MKRIWIPQLIATAMLIWALNPNNEYHYYVFLRWVCCGIFAYLAIEAKKRGRDTWVWLLGASAVAYNPVFRVHLTRNYWAVINVITAIIAVVSIFTLKKKSSV